MTPSKTIPMDVVENLKKNKVSHYEGFPLFNPYEHTFIDLSENGYHTVSVKLPNGDYVTICSTPFSHTGHQEGTIDIKYYGDKKTKTIPLAENFFTFSYQNTP